MLNYIPKGIDMKESNVKLMLGITKVGDLLFDNRITETKDGTPLGPINLTIPPYQRPYKWTPKNVNRLLDDIEDAMHANKEVYRVGTLILHKKNKNVNKNVKSNTTDDISEDSSSDNAEDNITENGNADNYVYDIVDGQQRTITFALLLKCINKYLDDESKQISFLKQELSKNEYNLRNISNNYLAIDRLLKKYKDDQELKNLCKYITDNCQLIVVITDDLSEAFQFFDSQNARGKALYPHDLLKAFHLREMQECDEEETLQVVKVWEDLDQKRLSSLFKEYLYRLKEWIKGSRPTELTERNIETFKGITAKDIKPYAQYFKGAYAYADNLNRSSVPFVIGQQKLRPFQLSAPIIAGKPFFEFAKYYFDILADIQNNDKFYGYFINDNEIVKALDSESNRYGIGNRITRLLFDTAVLFYVDRFCPSIPSKTDLIYLDQFVVYAFIWAYSMRAQYKNVGWVVAQNYVMGEAKKDDILNDFNIYQIISNSDSPGILLSVLAEKLQPLAKEKIPETSNKKKFENNKEDKNNYLFHFYKHKFL